MPATLVPRERIPELAAQIDSPAMLRVLRRLHQAGLIHNSPEVDSQTQSVLQRLTALGLVDPGYEGPTNGKSFIWVSNGNTERVLKYLEAAPQREAVLASKLTIHPRAHTALASLPEEDPLAALGPAEALLTADATSWPRDKVEPLNEGERVYLLRLTPQLRGFIRILDAGGIELLDVVPEETLRLFLERYRSGGRAG
jgi:hypothetical protein